MPWRPRSWWQAYNNLADRDPTDLVFAFAVYAIFYGISLLLPGDSFDVSPIYSVARELGIPEVATGAGMLLDALLLFVCLGWGGRITPTIRALISLATSMGWFFWGGLLLLGGFRVGYFAPGGAWICVVAILIMQATSRWATPGHEDHPLWR
jgi:hypothetical protein